MSGKDLKFYNDKNEDKTQLIKMLVIAGGIILLTFVLPFIVYITKPHNNQKNADNLFKDNVKTEKTVEQDNSKEQDNDNQVIDNSSIEDKSENSEPQKNEGSDVQRNMNDPFYGQIHDHISKLKALPQTSLSTSYYPGDNYIKHAVNEDGKLHIFKKKPILIYVPKNEYYDAITQAFVTYNYQFKGLLSFKATNDPNKSDVKIVFTDNLMHKIDNPNIIGVGGPKRYNDDGSIANSELMVRNVYPNGKKPGMILIYNVILHEIGHCIGIMGHSPNGGDLMFEREDVNSSYRLKNFSYRDIETIKLMYSGRIDLQAKALQNAKQEKLQENVQYAQEHNNSDSYLQVAESYYNMGQYDNALNAYKKAMELNPGNLKIYLKLTNVYIKAKKYDDAMVYAKYVAKKSTDNELSYIANDNIGYIYIQKKDYESALKYYGEALKLKPEEKNQFFNYVETCYHLDKKDLAREAYNQYIKNYDVSSFDDAEKKLLNWIYN